MSFKKLVWLAPLVLCAACNSVGNGGNGSMFDYQSRDLNGLSTDNEDDAYWRGREVKECNGIDDGVMRSKCADALRRERAKGLKPKT